MSRPRLEEFCWLGLLRIGGGLPLLLLILPWGASHLSAAPILLLNQQATAVVNIAPGMGRFGGWEFAERIAGTSPWDNPSLNQAYLQVGGWTSITASSQVEQNINATTTLTYDIPGFAITRISLYGFAFDGGNVAGEQMWITAPCNASVTGNGLPSQQYCWPTTSAQQITASLRMYTDITTHSGSANVGPLMLTLQLTPLVHNPEPTTMLLVGVLLVGLRLYSRTGTGC